MIFLLIDIENIFARPRKTLKDDKWGLIYLAKWTTHFLENRFSTVFNNSSLRSRHTLVGLISENAKIWWSLVRPHTKIYWVIVSLGTYQWAAILVLIASADGCALIYLVSKMKWFWKLFLGVIAYTVDGDTDRRTAPCIIEGHTKIMFVNMGLTFHISVGKMLIKHSRQQPT